MTVSEGGGLLRERREEGQRVTFIELFFDLVFVFAVTQLTHLLLEHPTALGAAQALLLLLAIWRAWIDMAWITNWFDPDRGPVRLLIIGVMLLGLIMSAALPDAFTGRGAIFGNLHWSVAVVGAFVVAFIGTLSMWWIYFYRSAEGGSRLIATSADPGRLGRSAYTYFHLPMVAGIIVSAVADEMTIAHPDGHTTAAMTAAIVGGSALFLAGHALFKWSLSGRLYISRLIGIGALAVMAPLGGMIPPLALAAAAMLVLVTVACWDTWAAWSEARAKQREDSPNVPVPA